MRHGTAKRWAEKVGGNSLQAAGGPCVRLPAAGCLVALSWSHTFAVLTVQTEGSSVWASARHGDQTVSDSVSLLGEIDRLCGQIASAMQASELQIYATLALIIVLSVLMFPRKDDPDQI